MTKREKALYQKYGPPMYPAVPNGREKDRLAVLDLWLGRNVDNAKTESL